MSNIEILRENIEILEKTDYINIKDYDIRSKIHNNYEKIKILIDEIDDMKYNFYLKHE